MEKFLLLYPNRITDYEQNEGLVTILFVNPNPNLIEKKFFKKLSKKPYKIDLDDYGSFVWNLCDGKHNIKDIALRLRDEFGDKAEPAEERVSKFIKQLSANKFIQLYKKNEKVRFE